MRHVLRISGGLLIAAGILLFFWQDIRETFIDRMNDRVISAYHDDSRPSRGEQAGILHHRGGPECII